MTKKDKLHKLEIARKISEEASKIFVAMYMAETKMDALKEDFINELWNMSLKDIAEMMDQITTLPKGCQDILK